MKGGAQGGQAREVVAGLTPTEEEQDRGEAAAVSHGGDHSIRNCEPLRRQPSALGEISDSREACRTPNASELNMTTGKHHEPAS